MPIDFDFGQVEQVEFGVGKEEGGAAVFYAVPVDIDVRDALLSVVNTTLHQLETFEGGATPYSPAEKHARTEYLIVQAGSNFEVQLRELHDANNLTLDAGALVHPQSLLSYFVRLTDATDHRVTAVRRATYFKGILRSPLVRIFGDTLTVVEDDVFKLDADFDLLVDSAGTHIWRPSAFEFLGGLTQAILDAVPINVEAIGAELSFVDFSSVEQYAVEHPRAARYLASIRTQELGQINHDALLTLCNRTHVAVEDQGGVLVLGPHSVMGFLEVLDRRRYELELVLGQPERFRAGSRSRTP